jgi:streptomycin 6-kinase
VQACKNEHVLTLPPVVTNKARSIGAQEWLASLPATFDELCEKWDLTLEAVYPDATEALVCSVHDASGRPSVLKILLPRGMSAFQHEVTTLQIANGEGCAMLLDYDEAFNAMLLERLGPTLHSLGLPLGERHEILCATVLRLWRRVTECDLPSGREKARWLSEFIIETWERLDRPCSERAVDHALTSAQSRSDAHDDERAVLVHGDVHEWNTLVAPGGFKLIDPDGLLAEAEYDLGVMMREDPRELLQGDPVERARWLARRCELDPRAVWEWGVVERVSTGLLATQVELEPLGRDMLFAADEIALIKVEW